jgi:hypothetical protein
VDIDISGCQYRWRFAPCKEWSKVHGMSEGASTVVQSKWILLEVVSPPPRH